MIPEAWPRLRAIVEEAREVPQDERAIWLDARLDPTGEERRFVDELLAAEGIDDGFLEAPTSRVGVRAEPQVGASGPERSPGTGDWSGLRVESFRVCGLIASGGMGAVYEAEQDQPRRRVALKIMHSEMTSPPAVRRFRHEAELLARLKHPAIAQVYESGVLSRSQDAPDAPWFALELVDGARPITNFAREEGLSLIQRIELFRTVCDAVHYGHQKSIVHRDLKPANILVSREGRPKVIDFGIAKLTGNQPGLSQDQSLSGEIVGTLLYMSPEQLQGRDEVDTRSDAYSLGVVLYELVSDSTTFDIRDVSITEACQRLLTEEPPPPSRHKGDVPRELDWIVAKAMSKDVSRRYRSVAEVSDDLLRFLKHETVSASPPGRVYQMRKFVRRHRVGVTAALLVSVAVVAGLVGTTLAWMRAVEAERDAEGQHQAALREAGKATAVVDFLVDVLSAPRPSVDGREVRVAEVLSRASTEYEERFAGQAEVRARLARALGKVYWGLGLRKESIEQFEHALAAYRSLDPGSSAPTANVLGNLGVVYLEQGDYAAAEAKLTASLAMENELGQAAPAIDEARIRLARLRLEQDRLEEAEELLRSGLPGLESAFGPAGHPVLVAKHSLASVLHAALKLDEARKLYAETLTQMTEALGPAHPDTLRTRSNAAMLAYSQGHFDEALAEAEELLRLRSQVLGEHHPETLGSLINLGGMLQIAGRVDDAMALYESAHASMLEVLAESDPMLQTLQVNLAQLERARGDLERADGLLSDVYFTREENLGPAHAKTLRVLYELAGVARESGALDLAEERAARGLDGSLEADGRAAHYTFLFQLELGRIWTLAERFADAEQILEDALATREGLGHGLDGVPTGKDELAALYARWGRPPSER